MAGTRLREREIAGGARLIDDNGWEAAGGFGSTAAEVRAARAASAVFDLSHFTRLRMTGGDRVRLLNAIVSNDIARLPVQQSLAATLLNVKGRLVASMTVYNLPDYLDLVLDPSLRARALPALRRYILREDVQVADITTDQALLEIRGSAPVGTERLLGVDPGALAAGAIVPLPRLGDDAWVAGADSVAGNGHRLLIPADRAGDLWTALVEAGCQPAGMEAWDILRIEDGVPRFGHELNETVMPAEANLNHALNYDKGCYTGQEVVASLKYRGKLARRLMGLLLPPTADAPAAGTILRVGETEAGQVTSSVFSPTLERPVALALVRRDFWEPGTVLQVGDSGGVPAEVAGLPLVG